MALPILTPVSQMSKVILPVTGNTANVTNEVLPFGMYLDSDDFISGAADQVAFTYKMLGGDVLDIELMEGNVYSSYETAVLEYSSIINSHQAENVLSNYLGMTSGTFDEDGELLTVRSDVEIFRIYGHRRSGIWQSQFLWNVGR